MQNFPTKTFLLLLFPIFTNLEFTSAQITFWKGSPRLNLSAEAQLSGSLRFSRDGRPFVSFEGIRFAKIPERFSPSELLSKPDWTGTKNATQLGTKCPQQGFQPGVGSTLVGSEDCLYLNVYVPLNGQFPPGRPGYPSMVWIHGGGFVTGSGGDYSPSFFMDEDVILITLNYRLGVFGFLSTGDEVLPGNLGLRDQLQALKWIQAHIRTFGGDPGLVTLFGESAGAVAANYLMLSPLVPEGLFHRVTSQSGTALMSGIRRPKVNAVKLAEYLNCADTSSGGILDCLRPLPVEELSQGDFQFQRGWPDGFLLNNFGPVVDSSFIPELPSAILKDKSRALKAVPWLLGVTEDEGACAFSCHILNSDFLLREMNDRFSEVVPPGLFFADYFPPEEETEVVENIREFYFGDKEVSLETRDNLTNMYSDGLENYQTERSALEVASRGASNPVYLYQFARRNDQDGGRSQLGKLFRGTEKESKMVGHTDDLPYLFPLGPQLTPEGEAFSKNLVKLWVSFAVNGYPSHSWGDEEDLSWTKVSLDEWTGKRPVRYYRLDENPKFIHNPWPERYAFWDKLFREHWEKQENSM